MALTIQMSSNISNNPITYSLQTDSIAHSFTRFAGQSPLPAESSYSAGRNFWLDLGLILEQISLTGVAPLAQTTSGIATKSNLEDVARTWWVYTNATIAASSLPQVTIASGQVYTFAVKQADFKTEAGREPEWYDFSMILFIGSKV